MKKILSLIFTVILLLSSVLAVPVNAAYDEQMEALKLYSDCVLLISTDNGEIIFEKNAGKQTPPASLTKVVTAITVLENCADPETATVTVPASCIDELSGTGSSLGGLRDGEILKVKDLLACLLIHSANEAATTLADYIGGGNRAKFISMMNEVVARLGCVNSNFVNPHGLHDENQYTTAEDMAVILKYAVEFPLIKELIGQSAYKLPATNLQDERRLINTNFLMNSGYKDYYCEYVTGGKTGSTSQAGRCVAVTASNNGYNYICVALNSTFEDVDNDGVNENGAFLDTKKMLEWTFRNIELVAVSDTTMIVGQIPVELAKGTDNLTLSPAEIVYSLVPKGTESGGLLVEPIAGTMPESVTAPIKKGEVICRANVLYAGNVIKEIDLVASMDAKLSILAVIGRYAWIIILLAAIVVIAVILIFFRRRRGRSSGYGNSKNYKVLSYNDFTKVR